MDVNGAAKKADDRKGPHGISQAVRGNSNLPGRAWKVASTLPPAPNRPRHGPISASPTRPDQGDTSRQNRQSSKCILLSSRFWPIPSMSRGVISSVKQRLSHPFSRMKSIDQWAVDPVHFLTLATSAKTEKTAVSRPIGPRWYTCRTILLQRQSGASEARQIVHVSFSPVPTAPCSPLPTAFAVHQL